MSYKITVTEKKDVVTQAGQEGKVIRKGDDGNDVLGYTPVIEKTISREIEIYQQTVEAIDMKALIAAVNK